MSDITFPYITRPANTPSLITTMPSYRGTKTQEQVYAEATARVGSGPVNAATLTRAVCEVIIDWTIAGWKIAPLGDGLIGFQVGCGGSAPLGTEPPSDFTGMHINLNGHYGEAGRDRAEAAFSAEKVGEQSRVTPVIIEAYDSASRIANHYVAGGSLTIILANRGMKFDPNQTQNFVRYRKSDGTFVTAGGYPYYKGTTIVANVPTGLTGALELRVSCEINGSIREGIYPFPLT
jgi:hypothetical protein